MLYILFRDCTTGKPCGDACISKNHRCRDKISGEDADRVDAFIAKVAQHKKSLSSKKQSDSTVTALAAAATREEKAAIVAPLLTTLRPEEARAILEVDREGGPLTNREFKEGEYFLPEMKRRKVSDLQVDAAWDSLTAAQRNLLFPRNAGAPDRGDRIKTDWDGNTQRMRKSMLKALMEQMDDEGRIIDPWTNKELKFPADLDHIVPLAKGGTHGSPLTTDKDAPYDGSNWVWVNKEINRHYKGDNDINGTIANLRGALDPAEYEKAVDEAIKRYTGEKTRSLELRQIASSCSIPHPSIIDTLTKKKEVEALMKGLSDNGYINRSEVTNNPEAARGVLKRLDKELPAAISRLTAPVAQVVVHESIAQIIDQHTGSGGLLDLNRMDDEDLGDFTNTLLQSRSRDQVPPEIAYEIDSMESFEPRRDSNSGWGQLPNIRKASRTLRQYIYDIGFNGYRTLPRDIPPNGRVLRRQRS